MYIIDTEIEKVCEEFSQVEKWIKTIHKKVLKTEVDNSKIQTYYSYGFFVAKPKEGEVVLTNDDIFKLKFKKRLKFELSKVRVDVTIKIGNFTMTNRLEKGTIPEDIKNIVTEITKVRMMVEGEYHQNKKVIQSIPEVDSKIVQYRIIRGDEDVDMEPMFDIDLILDKISKEGIQSLSPEEKDFLDKSSKHL
jgi:aconitase B